MIRYLEIVDPDHKEMVKKEIVDLLKRNLKDSFEDFMACGSVIGLKISDAMTVSYYIEEDRILYKTTGNLSKEGEGYCASISKEEYDKLVDKEEEEESNED